MKGIIFDFDGTLVDSMPMWDSLDRRFLTEHGITPPPGLSDTVKSMTIPQACAYYAEHFPVHMTAEEIAEGVIGLALRLYREEIPLKPGAEHLLRSLAARGIPFGAASANAGILLDTALERFGLTELFAFRLTPDGHLRGKEFPDLYLAGAECLHAKPEEIVVFEDALYAAKTAKRAGFYTFGIYEPMQDAEWAAMQTVCDRTADSLCEFDCDTFFAAFAQ